MKIVKLSIIVLTVLCSFTMVNAGDEWQGGNYAPENLTTLDYFVIIPDKGEWWTQLDLGFGAEIWEHAGFYSRSDAYGSKYLIQTMGPGFPVQETPASIFLKYSVNRVIWIHNQNAVSSARSIALQVLYDKIVDKIYYPEIYDFPFIDPNSIDLNNPIVDNKVYCSHLVYRTYKQLLNLDIVYWYSTLPPISPKNLADYAIDNGMVIHDYNHPEFNDILP